MKNTRKNILDAAQHLIEKDGSTRITTKEIARAAECAEGTLFKYFKTKEDLCLAVVLENAPVFRQELAQPRAGEHTVPKNLADIAVASLGFFQKLIPLAASLLADADLLKRHRKIMAEQERGPKDVFAHVAAYISEEQRLHRIGRHVSPATAAALLLGPCFHRAFIKHVMGSEPLGSTDHEFVAALAETLVRGLNADTAKSEPKR